MGQTANPDAAAAIAKGIEGAATGVVPGEPAKIVTEGQRMWHRPAKMKGTATIAEHPAAATGPDQLGQKGQNFRHDRTHKASGVASDAVDPSQIEIKAGDMSSRWAEKNANHMMKSEKAPEAKPDDIKAAGDKLNDRINKLFPQPVQDAMKAIQSGLLDKTNGAKAIAEAVNKIEDPAQKAEVLKAVQENLNKAHAGLSISAQSDGVLVYQKGAATGVMIAKDGTMSAVGIDYREDGPAISPDKPLKPAADVYAEIANSTTYRIVNSQANELESILHNLTPDDLYKNNRR